MAQPRRRTGAKTVTGCISGIGVAFLWVGRSCVDVPCAAGAWLIRGYRALERHAQRRAVWRWCHVWIVEKGGYYVPGVFNPPNNPVRVIRLSLLYRGGD